MGTTRNDYVEKCKAEFCDLQKQSRVLIRYTKNSKNQKVGVIVSFRNPVDNSVYVGVSKCNVSSGDRFNKYVGIYKALCSSVPAVEAEKLDVPFSMIETYNHQLGKIRSYFKTL